MNNQRIPCTRSQASMKQYATTDKCQPQASNKAELLALYALATEYLQFPEPEIASALFILSNLLDNPHLSTYPLLHAMTHILMGVNTPYSVADNCRRKFEHIDKAREAMKDFKEKENHSDACQGCMFVQAKAEAGKAIDEDDGNDCVILFRLERVCERESKAIEDWNWYRDDEAQEVDNIVKWAEEDTVMEDSWS